MSIKDKIQSAKPTQFFDEDVVDEWSKWIKEHDKEVYNQALEDFVENISLPMTEEQIGEIVEKLKR